MPRFAVVGHVEWVDFLTVPRVPLAGEIVHASKWWAEPAGGGAVAAVQLAKLAGTATFFTALGNDDHARRAAAELRAHGVEVEAVGATVRNGEALRCSTPAASARSSCRGNASSPSETTTCRGTASRRWTASTSPAVTRASLRAARAARTLVATPRAHDAFTGSDVTLDALVRSAGDAGEQDDWSARRLTVRRAGRTEGRTRQLTAAPARSKPLPSTARSSMPTEPATPSRPGSPSRSAPGWTSMPRWRWRPAAARRT